MDSTFKFILEIGKDGKVEMPLQNIFLKVLTYFKPEQKLLLTLETIKRQRSLPQNAYYWGVVIPLVQPLLAGIGMQNADGTFLTNMQTHYYLRGEFLREEIANIKTGEVIKLIGSTTELSTKQFNEYVENIAKFVAENFDVVLPMPNEVL